MGRSIIGKLKPYYIRKALRYLRHYGIRDFAIRVRERLEPDDVPYGPWFEKHRADEELLAEQRALALQMQASHTKTSQAEASHGQAVQTSPEQMVSFSIVVPCWRTPEKYLRQMIESVLDQSYPFLELVLVNASPDDAAMAEILSEYAAEDKRVKVVDLPENEGIAANTCAGIRAASGDFICFMDHDDTIAPNALFEAAAIIEKTNADLVYTDEDKIREDQTGGLEHFQPHFKPDFNLDLLRSNNYICHFLMVRKSLIEQVGGPDDRFEGAQDYEFILRCIDRIEEAKIAHVPQVLYHWRTHAASTADNPDSKQYAYEAGKRAIEEHLKRRAHAGEVVSTKDHGFYRVKYQMQETPFVSIIIPNREQKQMLEKCISAITAHTSYDNYEIIVVENNSSSKEILDYYRELRTRDNVRVIRRKGPFNFSAVNNYGAAAAKGDYIVFMNNDVVVRDGWLSELLSVCMRDDVGAVGAKLYFPDGRIQSAGVVVGIGGEAGSLFTGMRGSFSGYLHKACILQDLSAVTAALMIVKRNAFEKAGGFTEELAVAFNDVDLCLKLRESGYRIVFDPYAEAVHHESLSRGDEYTKEKAERYRQEASFLKERWTLYYEKGDPNYNPNFSLARWDYTLRSDG